MSIEVRFAGSEDLDDLIAADPYAQIPHSGRPAQIVEWVESGQCLVAERDGRLVGYSVLTRDFFEQFFIKLVAVSETDRRTGVGTVMIEHLFAMIPSGGKLFTSTNESNVPMRELLLRLGFVPSGQIDNLDDGDPELIFVRLLD